MRHKAPVGGSAVVVEPAKVETPAPVETPREPLRHVQPPPVAAKPVRVAPTRPPAPPTPETAADKVAAQLAVWLRVPAAEVSIVSALPATWPDACLGLPAEGEICASVMTPGFAVVLRVGDDLYELRSDESAKRVRLVSAPESRTGEPLVVWRDSRSFDMLIVGRQRVAFGRRGLPLLATPLAVPERAGELEQMLARYAPVQVRTPAGEVALLGVGEVRATAAEARMIAEWARLVKKEAADGLDERVVDRVLAAPVSRRAFEEIVLGRGGRAWALHGGRILAGELLGPAELEMLYGWLDRFESMAGEGTLTFVGEGIEAVPPEEQRRMGQLLNELAARLDSHLGKG